MPNLGAISQYGLFLFGLSVILNLALFAMAFLRG